MAADSAPLVMTRSAPSIHKARRLWSICIAAIIIIINTSASNTFLHAQSPLQNLCPMDRSVGRRGAPSTARRTTTATRSPTRPRTRTVSSIYVPKCRAPKSSSTTTTSSSSGSTDWGSPFVIQRSDGLGAGLKTLPICTVVSFCIGCLCNLSIVRYEDGSWISPTDTTERLFSNTYLF